MLILSTVIGKKLINQSESSDFHHPATLYLKFVYDMDSKAEFFCNKGHIKYHDYVGMLYTQKGRKSHRQVSW